VRRAVEALLEQGERLHYTQRNQREFWNISTRPVAANGWGYTVAQTQLALVRGRAGNGQPTQRGLEQARV
jgi:hypothetical protein